MKSSHLRSLICLIGSAVFSFAGVSHAQEDVLDKMLKDDKTVKKDENLKSLEATFADRRASVEVGQNTKIVRFSFKPGTEPASVTLSFKDGLKKVLNFRAISSEIKINMADKRKDPKKIENFTLDDQCIAISGLRPGWNISCFVRPNMEYYSKELQIEYIKKWNTLPPASEHLLSVELRLDEAGFELWIDGRYCGRLDGPRLNAVNIETGKGGAIKNLSTHDTARNVNYLPLDVSYIGTENLSNAKLSCKEGNLDIEGIPMIVSSAKAGDIGAVRYVKARAEECDLYLARSPLAGMPETFHFSVPANQYAYAHVLCMVEDEPEKVPELTARISRFVFRRGVSSDAIMDSSIRLPRPGEKLPQGVKQVGDISYEKNGRQLKAPLYLASIPLKTGAITDMVFQPHESPMLRKEAGLDFELLGRTLLPRYASHAAYPNNDVQSSVKVLGLTLERSPAELELKQEQLGNVFYNDEVPAIPGELRGLEKADCNLEWEITDYDGKSVEKGSKEFRIEKGSNETFRIPLNKLATGWYALNVKLKNGEKELISIPATAAILGKDTRKAGKESPYASRTASIMQPPSPETHGILMQKAGIRGITPMNASLDAGEKVYSQWKVYGYQIPWMNSRLEDEKAAEAEIEKKIREYLEKYPSASSALVFHESGGGEFPPEILDRPTPTIDAEAAKRDERNFKQALRVCKIYREKFPNIRLQLGNSGDSLYLLASMMRRKFPKEYIDAMGEESLGQAKMPENPQYEYGNGTALNAWHMKQLALKMGYGNLPVDACSEWKGRMSTDLGERTKAEWDMRDLLISYAIGYKTIRTPDVTDQGSMFYDTEYGSQGALRRYPLLYPKPSYVATATMTRILDCVEYIRQVPMESNTSYVLEFKRYGKEYVYAMWLPRSAAEFSFDFGKDIEVLQIGMLGKETPIKSKGGKITLTASSGPCYLISPNPVKNISRAKEIPDTIPTYFVANAMYNASEWETVQNEPEVKRSPANFYGVKPGDFTLTESNDPEKGKCLKIEFKVSDNDPASLSGKIRMKKPVAIPGTPNTIALIVKGNSSWGRVNFEFEDAEGEVWRSRGADWPANLSLNFDGWHLIRFPINNSAKWLHHIYPNWIAGYWNAGGPIIRSGGDPDPNTTPEAQAPVPKTGNKKIDYPIKLIGISVKMPRKVLNLTEMKDVKDLNLCLKDFGAYEDSGEDNPIKTH